MKRLFLLRHATADISATDATRPLAQRGRKEANWLGRYLLQNHLRPDRVYYSSATRTRETLEYLQYGMENPLPASPEAQLYLASAAQMLSLIQSLDPALTSAMIIAHNPGLSQLFHNLLQKAPQDPRLLKYPTCTLGIIDFTVNEWDKIKSNTGQLFRAIIPSDLMEPKT